MELAIDRLFKYIDNKGVSVSEFSKRIGVSNGYLAKQKSGKANIGSHIIEKIVRAFPDMNLLWLMTGEGSMIRLQENESELVTNNSNFINNYFYGKLKPNNYEYRQIAYYEGLSSSQLVRLKKTSLNSLEIAYNNNAKLINMIHYLSPSEYSLTKKFKPLPIFEDYIKEINEETKELIDEAGTINDTKLKTILKILQYNEEKEHWDNMLSILIDSLDNYKQSFKSRINNPSFLNENVD